MAAVGCQKPGCDHRHGGALFMHARCHMRAALHVTIDPSSRTVLVQCAQCKKTVVELSEPPS